MGLKIGKNDFFEISFRISQFWKVHGLKNMKVTYMVWHIVFNIFLPLKSFCRVKNREKITFFEISFRISQFWKPLGLKNMKVTYMVWLCMIVFYCIVLCYFTNLSPENHTLQAPQVGISGKTTIDCSNSTELYTSIFNTPYILFKFLGLDWFPG